MYGLQFKNELPEPVARELEQFISWLDGYLHQEHDEDGRHHFPDFTETKSPSSFESTITQIIERYQAGGQNWFWGPWLFNRASDSRARRAWLRPPNPAAGTYHNYTPIGIDHACVLEIEPDGNITITGLKTREGLTENRLLVIRNRDSANTITLKHENTGSLEPYRFDLTGGVDLVLGNRQTVWLVYDTGRERWAAVVTGHDSGGIAPGPTTGELELDAQLHFELFGDGAVIATGEHDTNQRVPWNFIPEGWCMTGDGTESGSAVVDLWLDTYANFPPTNTDSATGSVQPTISSAIKAEGTTLTGWTTPWPKGRHIKLNVDSVSTFTYLNVTVYGKRTS